MSRRIITIDPITRLEGHGKIQIYLNDEAMLNTLIFRCLNSGV